VTTQSSTNTCANQPETKSNPNSATEQHAIVTIQLNIVTRATYPEKIIRDNVAAPFSQLSIVITLPAHETPPTPTPTAFSTSRNVATKRESVELYSRCNAVQLYCESLQSVPQRLPTLLVACAV